MVLTAELKGRSALTATSSITIIVIGISFVLVGSWGVLGLLKKDQVVLLIGCHHLLIVSIGW